MHGFRIFVEVLPYGGLSLHKNGGLSLRVDISMQFHLRISEQFPHIHGEFCLRAERAEVSTLGETVSACEQLVLP